MRVVAVEVGRGADDGSHGDGGSAVRIKAPLRVRIVAAYFTLFGCVGALLLTVIALRAPLERFDIRYRGTLSALETVMLVLVTAGCFLTARLLRARRRSGAVFALVALAANIVMYGRTVSNDWPTVVSAVVGIGLLLSAWRDLRPD